MIRDEILSFGKNIPAVKKVRKELFELEEKLALMQITHECVFKPDQFKELFYERKKLKEKLELFEKMTEGYLNLE